MKHQDTSPSEPRRHGQFAALRPIVVVLLLAAGVGLLLAFRPRSPLAAADVPGAPAWVPDPANSQWIDLEGQAASHGLSQVIQTNEGTVRPTVRAGRACYEVVRTITPDGIDHGRYWYFTVGDWTRWSQWLGNRDVKLTVFYYDGKPTSIPFIYDSSDPAVQVIPGQPGAAKSPPAWPNGLVLTGSARWKIVTIPLPLADFQAKRINGADFRFGRVPADSDFALAGVALTRVAASGRAQAADSGAATLANAAAAFHFSKEGVIGIDHLTTGHSFTRPGAAAPLFILGLKRPGDAPLEDLPASAGAFTNAANQTAGDTRTLDLKYHFDNGIGVTAHIKLEPNGVSRWTLEIANPTPLEVAEVEYPILPGVRLGDSAADDTLFFPRFWGQVWPNPASKDLGGPTWGWGLGMRWMDLWDKSDGLYMDVRDPAFNDTAFLPHADSPASLQMSIRQKILVPPGSNWTSADRVVALHGGDWHQGADLYREYVAAALKPAQPAEWLRWADLWETQPSNDLGQKGWGVLPEAGDALVKEDVDLMAANRQMMDGMDGSYTGVYLYPALGWGSSQELAQQLAALRRRGIHYTPYMNWHLWAPGYGHYPRVGITAWKSMPEDAPRRTDAWWAQIAARDYQGHFPAVVTDRYAWYNADIGSQDWRDRLAYWTRRYLAWNADGMYYDQLSNTYFSGRRPADYNTYGFWIPATLDTLRRIRDESRNADPHYVSSGEGYSDILGQALDLQMTSGVVNRLEFYAYCNPDQIILNGAWNGGLDDYYGGYERERYIWQVGARFEQLLGPEPWRSHVLALRRRVKSLLYRSQFEDTVGLAITGANKQPVVPEAAKPGPSESAPYRGIIGRWFLFHHGGERAALINLINTPRDGAATVAIRTAPFGPVKAAWAFTLEGAVVPVHGAEEGGAYRFSAPASELSTVILVNRAGPIVEWTADRTTTGGETAHLKLSITNIEAAPVSGTASLAPPAGWPAAAAAVGPIAPGAAVSIDLPVQVPAAAADGRYDLHAIVQTPDESFTAYRSISVAEPVIAEFRGYPGSYHLLLENLSGKATSGTIAVGAPASLTVTAPASFQLPAHGSVSIPVEVQGQDRLQTMAEMRAHIVTPLAHWDLLRDITPAVPNGDFAMDSAGDSKADWWMGRNAAGDWDLDALHRERGGPSGQYCLRVDPGAAPGIRAYNVIGAVRPAARYHISAWIKRSAAAGEVYVEFGGLGGRRLSTPQTGQWVHLQEDVTSDGTGSCLVNCENGSGQPAWFAGITVTEVK